MAIKESAVAPINQQGLDIQSTPREEMQLYPIDTFAYEYPGKEIKIDFEITEFTAICPFSAGVSPWAACSSFARSDSGSVPVPRSNDIAPSCARSA